MQRFCPIREKMNAEKKQPRASLLIALAVTVMIVLLPLVAAVIILYLASATLLRVLVKILWLSKGNDVLLVYSDSPIWRDHVETHILPLIAERTVVLNWSERKHWKPSLARWAFFQYGGHREFNPLGVVFRPWKRAKVFRFWQPFRDFKHGNRAALDKMKKEFFETLGVQI